MRAMLLAAITAASASAQSLLFWQPQPHQLAAVPFAGRDPGAALATLLAGPRQAGLTTAIPPGTALADFVRDGDRARVVLNRRFLTARALGTLEDAVEQLTKTLHEFGIAHVQVWIRGEGGDQPLREALGETPPPDRGAPPSDLTITAATTGALAGRTIAISPGHGYYWHSTLGWTTQRGSIGGLIEDIHTNEIAMRALIPMLVNMGATVLSCRERGEVVREALVDNDQGAPRYTETGTWSTSASAGYNGGGYRFVNATPTATATATWDLVVPTEGDYPVYALYRAGTNRASDASYTVHHTGGASTVTVDQTAFNLTWVWLGTYRFTPASGARIVLSNRSAATGRVVIADAVRIGGGNGSIARGAGTSGRPRWQECSRYWSQFAGAPATVWDSIAGGEDNDDDVTARPRFAEWVGGCDAYLSLHTNAGGGQGTSTYIYDGGATAGSAALQTLVHNQIVADIRAEYDATWVDRGRLSANFGEVRVLSTMPGALIELAFHDTAGSRDHDALHDPRFRYLAARAIARGVLRYFSPTAPFAPEPPVAFRITQDGNSGLRLAWDNVANATAYAIEQSPDGKGFVEIAQTAATNWSTGPLAHDAVWSFRVRACNATGRSEPTDVLSAGTSHTKSAECLLVQGFDRRDRAIKEPANTKDYLRLHALALRAHGEFSLGFDAATNEAVALGRVPLAPYRAIDWAAGEESTADESLSSAEQALLAAYLAQGGRLLLSGAEVGWDLDALGSAADRAFYNGSLGARYVADDAATYAFAPTATGVFAGLPAGLFDDGTGTTYDVDFPDVLGAFDASSAPCLLYGNGQVAGLQRSVGNSRVLHVGFPIETVRDAGQRAALMARAMRYLLAPRLLDLAPSSSLGAPTPIALEIPAAANRPFLLAAALGTAPGLPLPGGFTLPLNPDPVFSLSLTPGNGVFNGFFGNLDGNGRASATLTLPNLPGLLGLPIFVSGFALPDLSGLAVHTMLPWLRTVGR